jgi:hypothetical protein
MITLCKVSLTIRNDGRHQLPETTLAAGSQRPAPPPNGSPPPTSPPGWCAGRPSGEGTPRPTRPVCFLVLPHPPGQAGFDEGFTCQEGLLALSRQQPFRIMTLTFGAVDLEASGVQDVRFMASPGIQGARTGYGSSSRGRGRPGARAGSRQARPAWRLTGSGSEAHAKRRRMPAEAARGVSFMPWNPIDQAPFNPQVFRPHPALPRSGRHRIAGPAAGRPAGARSAVPARFARRRSSEGTCR